MDQNVRLITSLSNPNVKRWAKLKTKKGRMESNQLLIEGDHLIEEAIKAKLSIQEVLLCEGHSQELNLSEVPHFELSDSVFYRITDTNSPQGIAAVISFPSYDWDQLLTKRMGSEIVVLLDSIQDPGNLGTIIRTSEATGVSGIILGSGCVDPFNSKVVRSAMGSLFRVPFIQCDLREAISKLKRNSFWTMGTSLRATQNHFDYQFPEKVGIVFGNEGKGVCEHILNEVNDCVKIPLLGETESLNVSISCGVVLYEWLRKLM